jgi:hypothetical protein
VEDVIAALPVEGVVTGVAEHGVMAERTEGTIAAVK